ADGADVTAETLAAAGVIRDTQLPLKVLGDGELTRKVSVTAAKFSASARAKIEAAGGIAHEVPPKKWTRPENADRSAEKKPAKGRVKPTDSGGAS
ncbi:MAG: uL15 family ribosomal protein, partial [Planctomycetota bacterium]